MQWHAEREDIGLSDRPNGRGQEPDAKTDYHEGQHGMARENARHRTDAGLTRGRCATAAMGMINRARIPPAMVSVA